MSQLRELKLICAKELKKSFLSLSLFYSLADVRQFLFLHEPQSKNDVDGNVASITEPNSLKVVATFAAATPENFCQPILNQHET